jgi:ABC-type Mn2+/Zn2+ transport system permease subunit
MLFFGALLVWAVEGKAGVDTEVVIGVLFSAALAIGSMITSGQDLVDALFGGTGVLTGPEMLFGIVAAALVVAFVITQRNNLVVMLISPDVARTAGINTKRLDLLYLLTFALTIALGLRYLGVLLMGALIIVPAATAKRVAKNLTGMLTIAVLVAVTATLVGTWLAASIHRETGSLIVTVAAGIFLLSFLKR